jgi:hypothetical protein
LQEFFRTDLSTPIRRSAQTYTDSIGQNHVSRAIRIKQNEHTNKSDQFLVKNRYKILANLQDNDKSNTNN